ncbi:hypothetical protein EHS19_04755 [Bifidobacterium jacchi]|uniref:Uncharacterized protein n=1 Tax=Bifidobacterium jacchi TaxID=2490545 RepID=A0A5N5RL42_9BIFI|nr:hypothetical protein EHS19_04755 [Bifidobacterium jacchi]
MDMPHTLRHARLGEAKTRSGETPLEAAKYQFVVFAAIAALTLVADSLILTMVYRTCFTADDQYKPPSMR